MKLTFSCCALTIALTGCGLFDSSSSGSATTATLDSTTDGGETGTATLTSLGSGSTQITITTAGGSDTGVQSAVMREGSCGSDGAIFALLNNVQGHASVTTLDSDLADLTGGKYYIDVHNSTSVNEVVACGSIP